MLYFKTRNQTAINDERKKKKVLNDDELMLILDRIENIENIISNISCLSPILCFS